VLQVGQYGVAMRPAREADPDLHLEVADLVQGQRLENDDPQRVEPVVARGAGVHPGADQDFVPPGIPVHDLRHLCWYPIELQSSL
jgi:hypothetical protein